MKINKDYMINSFDNVSSEYGEAVKNVGIWESEKDLINKYAIDKKIRILDMGCGAGRCAYGIEGLGYKNIDAIDFSKLMIKKAKAVCDNSSINFEVGDCTTINKDKDIYDLIIFSFNGLMMIPKQENRVKALNELHRVLKDDGIFIFTTHDRDNGDRWYKQQWLNEKKLWDCNKHDKRLHEFGDVLSYDGIDKTEYFIHIPNYDEVESLVSSKFEILDSFIRSHRYKEKREVVDFSDDCRFWVVKKI